jgi:hypothetical protein
VTVNKDMAKAYRHIKKAANMAHEREIYDIEQECREAMAYIAFAGDALGCDDELWAADDYWTD